MKFGVVMQPNPPAWQVVDYARRAEIEGFDHFGRSIPICCGRNRTSSSVRSWRRRTG